VVINSHHEVNKNDVGHEETEMQQHRYDFDIKVTRSEKLMAILVMIVLIALAWAFGQAGERLINTIASLI